MNSKIHLVEAKSSDVEVTYQIMCNSLKPYLVKLWDWDEAHQQKIHRKKFKASKTHLIKIKEEIIGYMVVSEKDKEIYLEHLLVDDQFQNLGIGTEVIHRLIQKSIADKSTIRLQVFKINIKAQKFYQDLEFIIISENEFNYEMKRTF